MVSLWIFYDSDTNDASPFHIIAKHEIESFNELNWFLKIASQLFPALFIHWLRQVEATWKGIKVLSKRVN